MQTLTRDEFDKLLKDANRVGYRLAYKRAKLRSVGRDLDNSVLDDLWLMTRSLNTFKNGKFTSEEFTNFVNSTQVRYLFNSIKKLANRYGL